jgi:hypothetical protein
MPFIDLKVFFSDVPVFRIDIGGGFLWHHRKRHQNTDLDCHLRLCPRGHREKKLESGPKSLHNSTDSERDPFRKRTNLSSTFKCKLHKPGGQSQQPIESVRLTLGQQWNLIYIDFVEDESTLQSTY